jgi:hypothetical protein
MVKSLGGKSEDRTGPTIVAIVETALKVASLAFGGLSVGSPREAPATACSDAARRYATLLTSAQEALNAAPLDDKMLAGRTTQIERLKAALRTRQTFHLKFDLTPPPDPIPDASYVVDGKALVKSGLLTADPFGGRAQVTLARSYAAGRATEAGMVVGDEAFHYREPVRMSMTARVGCPVAKECPIPPSSSEPVPFGVAQWGTPRRLPLRVGLFGNVSFSFEFQQDGTLEKQRGSTASAPAEGAASLARTIAGDLASSDPRTAALKARSSRVQAELDLMQAQAKLDAAKAAQANPTAEQP